MYVLQWPWQKIKVRRKCRISSAKIQSKFLINSSFSPDLANYDDDKKFNLDSNNYDKPVLNMENLKNGGYMDNKNDVDSIEEDLFPYSRGE